MRERSQDGIENQIKVFAHILRQESQYEISVLLQQRIFAPITAVGFGVGQMLRAVQLDDDARLCAQEIHLHSSQAVKTDRQLHVKAKATLRFRQCFQSAKQERFAGASGPIFTCGGSRWGWGCVDEKICQGNIHPVANEPGNRPRNPIHFVPSSLEWRNGINFLE